MPPDTCWSLIREKKERKPSGKRDIKDFQAVAVGERLPHTWNTNYVSQRNATLIFVASLTYTSPVLAPFSRSRWEEGGRRDRLHTRYSVLLFASFFSSPSCVFPSFFFFLLFFFFWIKRRRTNPCLHSLDQTRIPGIFDSQTNHNKERNNRYWHACQKLVLSFDSWWDNRGRNVRWLFVDISGISPLLFSQNLCNLPSPRWATLESSRFSTCWLGN